MKKMKKILLVVLSLVFIPLQVGALDSYKELDPDNNIHFPTIVWTNNDNKFYIYNYENYNLYYQYQPINKETASKIETIRKEGESLSKDEINNKKNACNTLKEKYNADKTEENKAAYDTCMTEYKSLVDEYNKKLDELNEKMFALYPDYEDSKWIQTQDNKFNGTIEGLTEDTMAVLWAKLVDNDSNETIYDAVTVTLQGNKITTDQTDNDENIKVNVNKMNKEQDEKNPNTSDNNIFALTIGAILSVITIAICSKKIRKVK